MILLQLLVNALHFGNKVNKATLPLPETHSFFVHANLNNLPPMTFLYIVREESFIREKNGKIKEYFCWHSAE